MSAEPANHAPQSAAPWVVLDTETTGLDATGDRIIEVAAVTLDPTTYAELDHRQWLINPGMDTGPAHVHGITNEMVADAPTFESVAPEIADYLHGKVLVAHNLRFDAGFLVAEFTRSGLDVTLGRGFCTYRDGTYCSLATALKAIDTTNEGAHRALNDVRATSTLFRWLAEGRYPDANAQHRSAPAWPQLTPVTHSAQRGRFADSFELVSQTEASARGNAWSTFINMWSLRAKARSAANAGANDGSGSGTPAR